MRTLKRNINRLIRREIGAKELMRLLVDEVVHTSKWNRTVGNKVLAMSMPRAAVEFNERVQRNMMFAAAPSDTKLTFNLYFETGFYAEPLHTVPWNIHRQWLRGFRLGKASSDDKDQDQKISVRFIRVPANPRPGRE